MCQAVFPHTALLGMGAAAPVSTVARFEKEGQSRIPALMSVLLPAYADRAVVAMTLTVLGALKGRGGSSEPSHGPWNL